MKIGDWGWTKVLRRRRQKNIQQKTTEKETFGVWFEWFNNSNQQEGIAFRLAKKNILRE